MPVFYIRGGIREEKGNWERVVTNDLKHAQVLAKWQACGVYDALSREGMFKTFKQYEEELGLNQASVNYRNERDAMIEFEAQTEIPEDYAEW